MDQLWVSLSTLPSRITMLRPTLDSLLAQTRQPDRIFLCLSTMSRREQCGYVLPDWLRDYAHIVTVIDDAVDEGPSTKLLGCLGHFSGRGCLIVVDDDMSYKPYFLEMLFTRQMAEPGASFSFYTYPYGPVMVGQGADGFSFHSDHLDGIRAYANKALQCPVLLCMDDLWFSAFLLNKGIPVKSLQAEIPGGGTVYEVTHKTNQLIDLTGDVSRGKTLAIGTEFLLENGMLGRPRQAAALVRKAARACRSLFSAAPQ
jgi:hypothetical protein